ncbi:MAG: DNA internalization-related competence protein ComEC/Rec2 [Firmicutes bacterium]|nr:DNA internalization-related competence protein ComEC/Rec2 [Bacillota bacterium]
MRRLAIFACSFAAAAALFVWLLPPVIALLIAAALLAAAALLSLFRTPSCKRAKLCALGLAVGLLWSWSYERVKLEPLRAYCGEEQVISVEVSDLPQETAYGCRVGARLAGGNILLYLNCAPETLSLGDTVTVNAEVVDVSRGSGDSENLYYQSRDISLLGFQRGDVEITPAESLPLRCYPTAAVHAIRSHIDRLFPDDAAGFVRALLTGDRSGLSYRTRNEMSITGISHIVAVSGMHVSLLVGVIMLLCLKRRRLGAIISILVMLFFAVMLGFTPSVTRAVIMNGILLLASLLKRENDAPTALSFALMVILALNPWAIANISLQLSFGALAGILLPTPRIYRWLLRLLHDKKLQKHAPLLSKLLRSGASILAASLGATALTQPLIAEAFGVVSLIAPLTNLLVLPLISLIFPCAFLLLLVGWLLPSVGAVGATALSYPIRAVLWLVRSLAKLPYAAVYTNSGYIVAWLVLVYVLLGVYFLPRKRKMHPAVLLSCMLVTLIGACFFSAWEPGETAVTVYDVGQGQCVLLRSGDFTALIDCGGDSGDEDGETVARSLLMSGRRSVDVLMLTHYDTDHVCGTAQLLSRIEVGTLLLPAVEDDTDNCERIVQEAISAGVPYRFIAQDTALTFDGGTLRLFAPTDGSAKNASLAALLSAQEYDILVTGDMESAQERELLQTHTLPDLEVLVAGHHGSKSSTSEALLSATAPDIVLISVGKNRYGHPNAEVLARIAAIGAVVYRTDRNGDITVLR